MRIEFLAPLGRAVERMKTALFRPFDAGKWIVVGFSAWLAWLGQQGGGGSGGQWSDGGDVDDFRREARGAFDWIQDLLSNPLWLGLIVFAAVLAIVLVIAMTWVSSRGKFVFLDNVVKDGREIVEPWGRTREIGNSLFWWRFAYGLVVLVAFVPFVLALWYTVASPFLEGDPIRIGAAVGAILAAASIGIVFAFISHYLENFVVPIMFRHGLRTNAAWGRFLGLFGKEPLAFVGYALLSLVLWFFVVVAIVILGCATCCCGFVILALPYLGTVVMLPVFYAYRAWSLEFLAQFGPDWTMWPAPPPAPEPAPEPPPPLAFDPGI
jgi:hypothetical protein